MPEEVGDTTAERLCEAGGRLILAGRFPLQALIRAVSEILMGSCSPVTYFCSVDIVVTKGESLRVDQWPIQAVWMRQSQGKRSENEVRLNFEIHLDCDLK